MNVSLARKELPPTLEPLIRSKKTMADVRQLIATNPLVGNSRQDAMQPVLCTLSNRLSSMEIKEEPVQVEAAASESDIASCFQIIHYIEPNLPRDNIKKETLTQSEHLRKFMSRHCSSTAYLFQVRKCLDPTCYYCLEFPVRMPKEEFGYKYAEFKDLYGKPVDEKDCRKWIGSEKISLLAVRFGVYCHVKSALRLGVCVCKSKTET